MMNLSTKGRYAVRAMLDLALNYNIYPVQLKNIADRQGISRNYLERIMTSMIKAGLVRSRRGKGGGFILLKKPDEINLANILIAAEGRIGPTECAEDTSYCLRSSICTVNMIWKTVRGSIKEILTSITLKDMMDMYAASGSAAGDLTYYI